MAEIAVPEHSHRRRWRIRVTGTVQGVGFRPFVYRHAVRLGLGGWVVNDSAGVLIDVEGDLVDLDTLTALLRRSPPPLARVGAVVIDDTLLPTGTEGFRIAATEAHGVATAPVSVDTAPCPACLAEVFDPADRRHRYPFTNCTDCGPRYTIVRAIPYDRPTTTMAGFTMCAACQAEYDDPGDRRFHAQPNACRDCGPVVTWRAPDGRPLAVGPDALDAAARTLRADGIVAVKGVGGYHLAADARSDPAVRELRRRKHRDDKPFAVMVADEDAARGVAHVSDEASEALRSPARPIVLMPGRGNGLSGAVAPGLAEVGLVLPYSPLHHLLLSDVDRPLVMTSGNLSDEPIAHLDDDAVRRLGPLVDGLLTHDRPIHIRCDDSVVRATGTRTQTLRRSRGFAPAPIALLRPTPVPLLAVGAELKSTVAVARDRSVVVSHHIGDLEHLASYEMFLQAIDHLCHLYDIEPAAVVHDLHPEYLSTKVATDLDLPAVAVQHHHAHVAACLVDNGRSDTVVGLAFDGLGYGDDGSLWGGEVLVADLESYERVGHLRPIAMPGGGAAIREPWRMARAWLIAAGCQDQAPTPLVDERRRADVDQLVAMAQGPTTTSIGRLFDAIGAIVTGRAIATYEAQAAIELEALARRVERRQAPAWPGATTLDPIGDRVQFDPRPLVTAVVGALQRGTPAEIVAARTHETIGRAAAAMAVVAATNADLGTVALTGGAFQNARLTEIVVDTLTRAGLEVLLHRHVPPNDGGISVGQAAIAATRL